MKYDWPDPVGMFRSQMFVMSMAVEASAVFWMRCLGLSGLWTVPKTENARMISEKQAAFAASGQKALAAALSGKSVDAVMLAAARPLRRKTKSNQKRLARLGPKKL